MAFAVHYQQSHPLAMHLGVGGLERADGHWEAYNGGAESACERPTAGELVHGVRLNRSPGKRSMRAKGVDGADGMELDTGLLERGGAKAPRRFSGL